MKKGFSNELYLRKQKIKVLERVKKFDRLYLEFGGKLLSDGHASRVLPGYKKDNKIKLLKSFRHFSLIYCVNSKDLKSKKTLGKKKLTYKLQVLKDIKEIEKVGIKITAVVITRYKSEKESRDFRDHLESKQYKVYFHKEIKGYPNSNVLEGFKKQPYIPIENHLAIITGPAGGSGKMATALSQVYHEINYKKKSGFAKFETFPIWNIDINHPINLAYEAATADLQDKNMVDPYHQEAYKKIAVNYNRDIQNFKILKTILQKITKKKNPFGYKSPTDMGINMAKEGITDDLVCSKAAIKEIKRREKVYKKEFKKGRETKETLSRMEELIAKVNFIYGNKS